MVAPNMEASVSRALTSLAFEHWIFRIRRRAVHRGQIIERAVPVFPGYIFVWAKNAWTTIKNIIGVRGFVAFGGRLENVPPRVIEGLRAQSDEHGVLSWQQPEYISPYRAGDLVSVFLSPGVSLQGTFQNLLSSERAVILLDWMGRKVPVSVNLAECSVVVKSSKRGRPERKYRVAEQG